MDLSALLLEQAVQNEEQGELAIAEMLYRGILTRDPGHAEAGFRLGKLLVRSHRVGESIAWFDQARRAAPHRVQIHAALAEALRATGQNGAAMKAYMIAACLQATQLNPADADAHFQLGVAWANDGDDAEAILSYRQAIAHRPALAEAHNNLGISLSNSGQPAAALAAHREAVHLSPDNAAFHCNLAHALLAAGDLPAGFREWEWRVPSPPRDFAQPKWAGEPYAGLTLLAHAEQGYGDTIQFCRYLPEVARLGGRLIVEARAPMAGLLRQIGGINEVIAWGAPLPPFDLHVALPSLPYCLGTDRGTIPSENPYLSPPADRVAQWRHRLPDKSFTIGLIWQGNPQGGDPKRAIPRSQLARLGSIRGIALVGLQAGGGPSAETPDTITDVGHHIQDFDDLAAAISLVDLAISVDTAAAHLAGALGRPVWTLLHSAPDWRWQLEHATTPWYPTMRLYRQHSAGDWAGVIDRVRSDLAARGPG